LFFLQGKAPKEIHAILTETLACFLPGWAKDLSAPLYYCKYQEKLKSMPNVRQEDFTTAYFTLYFIPVTLHCLSFFRSFGAAAPSGPGHPHSRGI